ncbi:MAG: hypothetical protein JXR25_08290 [Pontiellaceae bacterium]|nr:hypothetical protein [Pontiellaceae bacterium]MBN2784812.1 hypothetical protein [Pontiellaceae bacterium]
MAGTFSDYAQVAQYKQLHFYVKNPVPSALVGRMKTINPEWEKMDFATRSARMNIETMIMPTAENGRFDELMGDLHYLGSAKPTGDFLRQAVVCDGEWVAILAWGPGWMIMGVRPACQIRRRMLAAGRNIRLFHGSPTGIRTAMACCLIGLKSFAD